MLFHETMVLTSDVLMRMFLFLLQRTPMEVAAERGHMDIVQYLKGDSISDVNI